MKSNGEPHNREKTCLLCERIVLARGLCRSHYHREYRGKRKQSGNPLPRKRRNKPQDLAECIAPRCSEMTTIFTGLCSRHHRRADEWQMTPAQLVSAVQDKDCAICGREATTLDHAHGQPCEIDHKSRKGCPGCYRGHLCSSCNTGIGLLGDSPDTLLRALAYLRGSHPGNLL